MCGGLEKPEEAESLLMGFDGDGLILIEKRQAGPRAAWLSSYRSGGLGRRGSRVYLAFYLIDRRMSQIPTDGSGANPADSRMSKKGAKGHSTVRPF
jgi:hypothetical protein